VVLAEVVALDWKQMWHVLEVVACCWYGQISQHLAKGAGQRILEEVALWVGMVPLEESALCEVRLWQQIFALEVVLAGLLFHDQLPHSVGFQIES